MLFVSIIIWLSLVPVGQPGLAHTGINISGPTRRYLQAPVTPRPTLLHAIYFQSMQSYSETKPEFVCILDDVTGGHLSTSCVHPARCLVRRAKLLGPDAIVSRDGISVAFLDIDRGLVNGLQNLESRCYASPMLLFLYSRMCALPRW